MSASESAPRILCAAPLPRLVADRAEAELRAILSQEQVLSTEQVLLALERWPSIEGLIVTAKNKFNRDAIAALPPRIRFLATTGVGFDHIDVDAATAKGIVVTNTPDVLTDATADLTFLLLLAAARRATEYSEVMRRGWRKIFSLTEMLGVHVSGKRLGLLGMGRIGRAVAARARGFGMSVLYHSRKRLPPDAEENAEYFSSIDEMLPHCQILSLHLPGGQTTRGVLSRERIAMLPYGAIVVNAARGSLIDEDALIVALTEGRIAAAGLDVFAREPDFDLRFLSLPNVFLTPHMGSATVETRDAMGLRAVKNAELLLRKNEALDLVSSR